MTYFVVLRRVCNRARSAGAGRSNYAAAIEAYSDTAAEWPLSAAFKLVINILLLVWSYAILTTGVIISPVFWYTKARKDKKQVIAFA